MSALAAKDTDSLLKKVALAVAFRGMTPGRFWAADSSEEAVTSVLEAP